MVRDLKKKEVSELYLLTDDYIVNIDSISRIKKSTDKDFPFTIVYRDGCTTNVSQDIFDGFKEISKKIGEDA